MNPIKKSTQKNSFQPGRLSLIRLVRGITQSELGEQIGVSRQFVHQLERSQRQLTSGNKTALAAILGVRPDFFDRPVPKWVERHQCNFRKFKTTTQTFEDQVIARATLLVEVLKWLSGHLHFPTVNIPRFPVETDADIESAAAAFRREWDLGSDAPIDNVTRLLENAGIFCVDVSGIDRKISAMSIDESPPLLLHNKEFSQPTRYRFDLAHELGHLVMHQGKTTGDDETESQADRFASAFLMPMSPFVKEFSQAVVSRLHWPLLASMKKRWGVSFKALLRRGLDLGLISWKQYRGAHVFLNSRGYAKREPYEPEECETPELLPLSFKAISAQLNIFGEESSRSLGLSDQLLSALIGCELPSREMKRAQVIQLDAFLPRGS